MTDLDKIVIQLWCHVWFEVDWAGQLIDLAEIGCLATWKILFWVPGKCPFSWLEDSLKVTFLGHHLLFVVMLEIDNMYEHRGLSAI